MNKNDIEIEEECSAMLPSTSPITVVRNHIYLNSVIDENISRAFINTLDEKALNIIITCFTEGTLPCPIELHINSYGGNIKEATSIIDAIKNIQNGELTKVGDIHFPLKVNTHIEGEADSCASLIACVGNYRTISKNALSMLHEPYIVGGPGGKADDVAVVASNLQMTKDIIEDIYLSHSNLTKEALEAILKDDGYNTPKELLEYGLVDEIV